MKQVQCYSIYGLNDIRLFYNDGTSYSFLPLSESNLTFSNGKNKIILYSSSITTRFPWSSFIEGLEHIQLNWLCKDSNKEAHVEKQLIYRRSITNIELSLILGDRPKWQMIVEYQGE